MFSSSLRELLCFVTVGIQIMNSRPIDWQSRLLRCLQLNFCSDVHFSRLVIKSVLADTIQTSHTHPKCYIYAMWNLFIVWCSYITVCVWMQNWATLNKEGVLSQRWPHNVPHIWVPWKFSGLPDYTHGYFFQNLSWAFVRIDPMNVLTKSDVCKLPVPEIK